MNRLQAQVACSRPFFSFSGTTTLCENIFISVFLRANSQQGDAEFTARKARARVYRQ